MTPTTAERPSDVVLVSQTEFGLDSMLTTDEDAYVAELFDSKAARGGRCGDSDGYTGGFEIPEGK